MSSDERPVVLVIDDEESILRIFETWLADEYAVRTATNGSDGLDKLDETVDVVLLDRRMPGMSGDDVLTAIAERDGACQVAVVTAVDPDFEIAEMPFDTYVTKPLDRPAVVEVVERLLARAEYDSLVQEHYALAEKLATLESEKTDAELATSERYQEAAERFADLDARLAEQSTSLDREDIVRSIPDAAAETEPSND
jgi:DNA-binding NtrC family response regulator